MPREHLPDDWVVAYAAGTMAPAESVVVATHLTLCPACREAVAVAEAGAAVVVGAESPADLEPDSVDALMARLDEGPPADEPPPVASDPVLPWPVLQLSGPVADLSWRWMAPFTRGVDLPVPASGLPLRLVRMSAGAYMPHRHTGREVGLILQGGWSDAAGHHGRGDLAIVDDLDDVHHQRIDPGEDCIALVLNDAPAVPAVPFGSLLARWMRI